MAKSTRRSRASTRRGRSSRARSAPPSDSGGIEEQPTTAGDAAEDQTLADAAEDRAAGVSNKFCRQVNANPNIQVVDGPGKDLQVAKAVAGADNDPQVVDTAAIDVGANQEKDRQSTSANKDPQAVNTDGMYSSVACRPMIIDHLPRRVRQLRQ